jgi:octaheme c-type cytochrome (tetrathionate reductase family)
MAGYPVSKPKKFGKKTFYPPNYQKIAQNVGRPKRTNCGTCHFFGGGGDGVKHGDLDSSLINPDYNLDVHMAVNGANFTCVRCHTTEAHSIAGRCYKKPAFTERKSLIQDDLIKRISCESCHTDKPHKPGIKANDHTDKVACQTCHIPAFARKLPTKMWWDWSKAGKFKNGKPFVEHDELGKHKYHTKKGEFVWKKNVQPEYFWFNGSLDYILLTDKIDPSKPVQLNKVIGNYNDPKSRIYPFKVHRGKQPYDKINKTMVVPHLFGSKESGAYWKTFDWQKAIKAGMDYAGLPYSGQYDFVQTEYHFPITHMVAPKEKSLSCYECHSRNGRLAKLSGFYMPGRDYNSVLDSIGWFAVFGSLAGVGLHGFLRIFSRKKD